MVEWVIKVKVKIKAKDGCGFGGEKLCERYLNEIYGIHLYCFKLLRMNFRKD
jgi:hypothetical protein